MPDTNSTDSLDKLESTLPSSWYLSDEIYELERENIFMQEWLCVIREEEIPEPGDHKVLDVYGESILLIRNDQHELKGFYNVCRHRGATLCPIAEHETSKHQIPVKGGIVGKSKIVCPYHAWTYDLDGQLINARHMTTSMGFNIEDVQLHKVGCETWGGFVFIHLTPVNAVPFSDCIKRSADQLKRYPLKDLRIAKTITYEVNANWKVLCENYNECYHCGPVHPELCNLVPAFREAGGSGVDWDRGVPHREGATTFTSSGTSSRRTFPGLNQDEQTRHKGDLVYPNLFLSLAREHVAVFILRAQSANRTIIDCHFLFETHEIEKPDFDASDATDFWHLVNRQDWAICESVQKGMNARVHNQGVFSPMEDWNLDIRQYVKDRIGHLVE